MLVSGVVTKFYNAGVGQNGKFAPASITVETSDKGTVRIVAWPDKDTQAITPFMNSIIRANNEGGVIGRGISGECEEKKAFNGIRQFEPQGMLQLEGGSSVASSPAQGPSYSSPSVGAGYADTPSRQELGMAKGNATNAAVLVVVSLIEKTGEIPSEADVIEACSRVVAGAEKILAGREPDVYVEDDDDDDDGEILSIREVS